MNTDNVPDFTKPIDIKAFFFNEFGACGCSEIDTMIEVIRGIMEWMNIENHALYSTLFHGNLGVYYLIIGILDRVGLCEHGVSIRWPILTEEGRTLLSSLQTISAEAIDEAEGDAYDELYYPNIG